MLLRDACVASGEALRNFAEISPRPPCPPSPLPGGYNRRTRNKHTLMSELPRLACLMVATCPRWCLGVFFCGNVYRWTIFRGRRRTMRLIFPVLSLVSCLLETI